MERKENLVYVKQLIEDKIFQNKAIVELRRFLISKGLSKAIVDAIFLEMKRVDLNFLKERLACCIKTAPGLHFGQDPKVVALVGPAGVGKTTMILKLANYYSETKRLALMTFDHEKGGAYAQLEKYAKIWKLPLFLKKEEMTLSDYDLVLVDTSGCNTYESTSVEGLFERLSSLSEVEVHLTMSAASKEVDLCGAIHQFSVLNPTSLIFTKFDETLAPGVVVNISARVDTPISFVAYGYPLPGKIEMADPHKIAHKILTDLNQEQFHFLRSSVNSSLS